LFKLDLLVQSANHLSLGSHFGEEDMFPVASRLSSATLMLVRLMESLGIDVRKRFRELGADYELLHDPNARIPDDVVIQLWNTLVQQSGDPCVGLKSADFWHPTSIHALGFAWMASSTLKEAFERVVRYGQFITQNQRYVFDETASCFRFTIFESEEPFVFPHELYDAQMSFVKTMCDEIYGPGFSFLRIDMRRPEPSCAEQFRGRFKAPIVFGADSNTLYFSKEVVLKELPTANADLARINEEVVRNYLEQVGQGALSRQVKARLIEQMPSGRVSQDTVASALHMSSRTLQRRLQEEGTSYKQLLAETRHELATRYMTRSDSQVSEVAYLLGFSEVGNFTRAFKRWTGVAPSEYRSMH
jgi:AraC-like DNA-binding protein